MRILVLTSTFPRWEKDTIPTFIKDLCTHLADAGIEVDVLAPHYPGSRRSESFNGVNITRFRYFYPERLQKLTYGAGISENLKRNFLLYFQVPIFLLSLLYQTQKALRSRQYDVVHAHWIIPQGFVAVLSQFLIPAKNKPSVVCTAHGSDIHAFGSPLMDGIRHWIINRCNSVCVVSHAMKQLLMERGIDEEKLDVIPMGIDFSKTFYERQNFARKKNRVLFAGRLIENKGVLVLLDAFNIVLGEFPDTELLLVGDGPLKTVILEQCGLQGIENNIILVGPVANQIMPEYYSSALVTVVPSFNEGLGMVSLEAMGCGSAVIASDLASIHDIIENEMNGLLVKPGDPKALADMIIYLLHRPEICKQLAENGRNIALEKYSWPQITGKHISLYNRLVRN